MDALAVILRREFSAFELLCRQRRGRFDLEPFLRADQDAVDVRDRPRIVRVDDRGVQAPDLLPGLALEQPGDELLQKAADLRREVAAESLDQTGLLRPDAIRRAERRESDDRRGVAAADEVPAQREPFLAGSRFDFCDCHVLPP